MEKKMEEQKEEKRRREGVTTDDEDAEEIPQTGSGLWFHQLFFPFSLPSFHSLSLLEMFLPLINVHS